MDSRIHSLVVPESTADACGRLLGRVMRADERVLLLGEAVGRQGGALGGDRGLLSELGPQRVIDTPIAEEGLLGLAFGLALGGKRPVVELAGPSPRLWAQLSREIATVAERSRGEYAAPVVLRLPYGPLPGLALAPDDEPANRLTLGALCGVPGLQVICASSAAEAEILLGAALESAGPVLLLEPRALFGQAPRELEPLPPGRARVLRSGSALTVLAWGAGVAAAEAALDSPALADTTPELLDLRCLNPLDSATLAASVARTGRVLVVDELHGAEPSLPALRALALATKSAFLHLESPPVVAPADPARIAREALESLRY